jgi:hypothetical protein
VFLDLKFFMIMLALDSLILPGRITIIIMQEVLADVSFIYIDQLLLTYNIVLHFNFRTTGMTMILMMSLPCN